MHPSDSPYDALAGWLLSSVSCGQLVTGPDKQTHCHLTAYQRMLAVIMLAGVLIEWSTVVSYPS